MVLFVELLNLLCESAGDSQTPLFAFSLMAYISAFNSFFVHLYVHQSVGCLVSAIPVLSHKMAHRYNNQSKSCLCTVSQEWHCKYKHTSQLKYLAYIKMSESADEREEMISSGLERRV